MNALAKIKKIKPSLLYFLTPLVLILSTIADIRPQASFAIGGGWNDPLTTVPIPAAGFLSNNCGHPGFGDYIPGRYHIANDYGAAAGANVFSIGTGTVVDIQTGWPGDAVYIKHTAADGVAFMAVYGHLNSRVTPGSLITRGQLIGKVLDQGSNSHLHFGIRTGLTPAPTNNGAMACPSWPDSNGYVDPVPFLTAHSTAPPPPPKPPPPPPAPPRPTPPTPTSPPGTELPLSRFDCSDALNKLRSGIPTPSGVQVKCGIPTPPSAGSNRRQ